MTRPWGLADFHFSKRSLSLRDKQSLPCTSGKALVLPGSSDTEVEELIHVGFDPAYIYGIEQDIDIAEELHEHYYDTTPIYCEEVGEFLHRASSTFSYIHLDYCSQLTNETLDSIEKAMGRLNPLARLRVSVFGSRRTKAMKNFERDVLDATLFNLLDRMVIAGYTTEDEVNYLKELILPVDADPDLSRIICVVLFVNHVLNMSWYTLCDLLPEVMPSESATHQLLNVKRYRYHSDQNIMYTAWMDFSPIPDPVITRNPRWLPAQILSFAYTLVHETPDFVVLSVD